ncbi:avidin/streptavidin family protein [Chryseobacterium wanjuense]
MYISFLYFYNLKTNNMINLNGTWYNELGSKMTITVNGNSIIGTYQTSVGDATGIYDLVGLTDTDNDTSQAIGWIVVWQNSHGSSDSVTSWNGQLQEIDGIPTIVTTWLLTEETDPNDNWRSTLVGKDIFTPMERTDMQIQESIKNGVKASSPKINAILKTNYS